MSMTSYFKACLFNFRVYQFSIRNFMSDYFKHTNLAEYHNNFN